MAETGCREAPPFGPLAHPDAAFVSTGQRHGLHCASVTTWQAARVGLAVCVVGLCLGFLAGRLNLSTWAFLAAAFVVAWFGGPLVARLLLKRRRDRAG